MAASQSSLELPPSTAVLGTGLIGGSIMLGLLQGGVSVAAWDPDPATQARLIELATATPGLVAAPTLEAALVGAELVFLAPPPAALESLLNDVLDHAELLAPEATLTDVVSVKARFAHLPAQVWERASRVFLLGHPMAGREHAGLAAALPELFHGATWAVCSPGGDPSAVPLARSAAAATRLLGALEILGVGRVVELDAAEHDLKVAAVSHLPHLGASLLAAITGSVEHTLPGTLALAGGGFRYTTRVAAGDPDLWVELAAQNAAALAPLLLDLAERAAALGADLAGLATASSDQSAAALARVRALLDEGVAARQRWEHQS